MEGRIHHVGVIVADLANARRFLEDALGFRLEQSLSLPDKKLEAGFFSMGGGTQVELIELGEPQGGAERAGGGNARGRRSTMLRWCARSCAERGSICRPIGRRRPRSRGATSPARRRAE